MAEAAASFTVQVCHAASPQKIFLLDLEVASGTTVLQAIQKSGLLDQVESLDLATCRVGIWSKLKALDTVVRERDRIEVYRPLIADPMDARRARAAKTNK